MKSLVQFLKEAQTNSYSTTVGIYFTVMCALTNKAGIKCTTDKSSKITVSDLGLFACGEEGNDSELNDPDYKDYPTVKTIKNNFKTYEAFLKWIKDNAEKTFEFTEAPGEYSSLVDTFEVDGMSFEIEHEVAWTEEP